MASRFAKPSGTALSAAQQELIADLLGFIRTGNYEVKRLVAGIDPYVARMSQACATDKDRAPMVDELERWIRWDRIPAFWLTWVFQRAHNGILSSYAILSWRLYGDAQINLSEDRALLSLENAFVAARKSNLKQPDPEFPAAALSVAEYRRQIFLLFQSWYSLRPYSSIEPLSEHLYDLRVARDLRDSFRDLRPEDMTNPAAWSAVINACAQDESYLRVIGRRFAGWALEKTNDPMGALEQYQLGLSEALQVGIETEIGHLLRYSANVLRRQRRFDRAEQLLRIALQIEAHPELCYWRALSARELGRVLRDKGLNLLDAKLAFDEGRESFDDSLVSSNVPVARAVRQQIARAYADDAIEVARRTDPLSLLSELEAAGPRFATDVLLESLLARQLPPAEAQQFRRTRSVFDQDLGIIVRSEDQNDEDFIASLSAALHHYGDRDRYAALRRRLGPRLPAEQRSTAIARRIAALDLPKVSLLVFHIAENSTLAVLIDGETHGVTQQSIDLGFDFWRSCSDTYHADLAAAMASQMRRNELLESAIDAMLSVFQTHLAPLLAPLIPALTGKHLIIVPRLGLSEVPLHALLFGGKPLIEYADVSYVPTLGAFLALRDDARSSLRGGAAPVTAIQDEARTPAYTGTLRAICGDDSNRVNRIAPSTWDSFQMHVASRPPTDVFFACHGHFDLADPRNSTLQFSRNEWISFTRLFSELDLAQCRSVVMGACESGLGRTLVAAEYVGLPLVFLSAGVPFVVGTLWQVNRLSSALLLARHYQLLRERNLSVPEALNAAQREIMRLTQDQIIDWIRMWLPENAPSWEPEIRKRGPYPFSRPYYWAGFYLTGTAG